MKTRTLLLAVLIAAMPAVSYGQLGNVLKKATSKVASSVGKAVNKEANNQIDSAAQKQADKMVNNAAENQSQVNQGEQSDQGDQGNRGGKGMNLGGLFGGNVTCKYNENYNFNSRMYMVMEVYDKKEVTKMDYFVYFSTSVANGGMEIKTVAKPEDGEVTPVTAQMIVDGENKCFMMLTDMGTMKMGIISPLPDPSTVDQTDPATGKPAKQPVVTKTGNTKMIAGYKCDEYLYKEEATAKEYAKLWMTKDAVFNVDKRLWSQSKMGYAYNYPGFEGMVAMGWENYSDKNELLAKAETKEVNKNFPYSMTTKGFSFRQMDFSKMGEQNKKK